MDGDEEVGGARGFGKLERHEARRRSDRSDVVDHRPRWVRGGRGDAAAEAAGDGGGEAKDAPERHLRGAAAAH